MASNTRKSEQSAWRTRLSFMNHMGRLLCTITGLSLSIGMGLQSLFLNQEKPFSLMLLAGTLCYGLLLVDYHALQKDMQEES